MSEIGLMPKTNKNKGQSSDEAVDQNQVLEEFSNIVKEGGVTQFIIVAQDDNGQLIMASYAPSFIAGVGLLEIGKMSLMNSQGDSCE